MKYLIEENKDFLTHGPKTEQAYMHTYTLS